MRVRLRLHHVFILESVIVALKSAISCSITLDPRLPFPDSVGGIFPGPCSHSSKSVSGYLMVFPAGGATIIDSFERVD